MKTAGIIGGIAPESTIEYYRAIIRGYRHQRNDGSYPPLIINSIDLTRMISLIAGGQLDEVTGMLLDEIRKLERAGVDFGLFASNTPHIVFDELQRQSPIELISIVDAACKSAVTKNLHRLALFGTRFTMQGRFYADVFSRADITIITPDAREQEYIHHIYMNELVNAIFRPETRDHLLSIVDRLVAQEGIDGLVLGGTELPLILRDAGTRGIPFLDTTQLHADQVVARLLS